MTAPHTRRHAGLVLLGLGLAVSSAATSAAAQVRTDSTAPRAPAYSARRLGGPTPPGIPPGAVLPVDVSEAPADPILARACAGEPGGTEAPGLLAVIFRARTPDTEQAAAAKAVGGTLAGQSPYGDVYVTVPDSAGPLRDVADRLIRQDPVTTVSPVPCPPEAAPPPTVSPAPASAAPSGGPGGTVPPPESAAGAPGVPVPKSP